MAKDTKGIFKTHKSKKHLTIPWQKNLEKFEKKNKFTKRYRETFSCAPDISIFYQIIFRVIHTKTRSLSLVDHY